MTPAEIAFARDKRHAGVPFDAIGQMMGKRAQDVKDAVGAIECAAFLHHADRLVTLLGPVRAGLLFRQLADTYSGEPVFGGREEKALPTCDVKKSVGA